MTQLRDLKISTLDLEGERHLLPKAGLKST